MRTAGEGNPRWFTCLLPPSQIIRYEDEASSASVERLLRQGNRAAPTIDGSMNALERRETRLQARLDAVDEDIRAEDRRAGLSSRRSLFYEERPAYAAPIVVMTVEELTRL